MRRILVGGMRHESNSFNPIIADEKDFNVEYGMEILNFKSKNDSLKGIIDTLINKGYEVVPTVNARAVPNGEVSLSFYQAIKKDFLERAVIANEERKIDAINLALHGSMRVKGLGEAEGDLLIALKELFPDTPIVCALDMHTTMTDNMHQNCEAYVGYKFAPHTDCFETGEHSAKMLIEMLENNTKLTKAWVRLPALIAGEKSETSTEPMVSLMDKLRKLEKREDVLATSYLMGYPWADSTEAGIAAYVVTSNNQGLADKLALELADEFWSLRDNFKFHTETYHSKKSIDKAFEAIKEGDFPIYLSDSGDNPTAGSSSDCTELLELILKDERTSKLNSPVIYGGIYDPEATLQCEGEVGKTIEIIIGAKFDVLTTKPLIIKGTVKNYLKSWGNYKSDLALINSNGVDIIVSEKHVGYITPEMFIDLGLNPLTTEIIVCKLGYLTDPHRKIAKKTIMALSKGSTNEDIENIRYDKVLRPIYPLDKDFDYDPKENLK
ncbi:M81 family metallopeptidase [Psychrilyobacter atlanticus]|uniref:M81 family metallopeptidase n=1 Tax=Psychrilyobacter atlanticus TaxID=271091 RepID=UPI0003F696A5|nr:M81 family metallopeptidase [Psychrilyobacter atlanticus]